MDFCHGSRVEKVSLLINVIMNDSANIYYVVFFLQICRLPLLVIFLLFWKNTDGFKGAVFSSLSSRDACLVELVYKGFCLIL